jgi:serine/threonine-protein kinase
MGTVYEAERADGAFEQRVAIKLLPAGTRADLQTRFLVERRILARLRHPNIACLMDGGTTDDGLPYLVMEYVEGEPLTDWCARERIAVRDRIRLFLDVCAAVAWAHQNLVVHRDLKPANVLVVANGSPTGFPEVKLLDFGIAKLLDAESTLVSPPSTRADLRLMTPDYAAPEQVRGEATTTATDVYQLGGLLYELLTGQRPRRLRSARWEVLVRAIEEDPPRPSVAVAGSEDGRRLQRALEGDLDTIVLRALASEPGRRYTSVDALARDLRRHLAGRPVEARPDTVRYRVATFVRSNRPWVLVAGGVALLVLSFTAAMTVQAHRVAAERDRADDAAAFLIEILGDLEPVAARGAAIPTRAVLDRALSRAGTELTEQPLLRAQLFDALGRAYQLRGLFGDAEPVLREALDIRKAELGDDHVDIAASQHALAELLGETGRHAEGEVLLARASATYSRRLGASHPTTASVQVDRALARRAAGELPNAEELLEGSVAMLRDASGDARLDLATALLYLGKVRVERGMLENAEQPLREALDLRRMVVGAEHPTVANALDGVGELMMARGDLGAAAEAYREALTIREAIFPADHADVGVGHLNVALVLEREGRLAEAAARAEQALGVLVPTFGEEHPLVRVARRMSS